jgi:hypothetical protein
MLHNHSSEAKSAEPNATVVIESPFESTRRRFSRGMRAGVLCFVLSVLFYYGGVLRVQLRRTDFLDLGPYPDAVEYFAQANSIMKDGKPTIQIGYDKLPSRYPPGYPVLMIPWLSCLPENGILAPFRTNQTIGLLLLVGAFGFYCLIGRPLAGGLGTLLLATQPAFITFSRSSLSDLSGAAAALLAFALVYIGLTRMRRWPVYAAAFVLGLSLCIRPQLLFLAPLLVAAALFPAGASWAKWLLHCCLIFSVFAAAALAYFVFNTLEFGHPLKTGYNFWVPSWAESDQLFSRHNIFPQLAMLSREITASWTDFRVANLFGTGTYIVAPFILLALIGLAFVRVNRFAVSAFLAGFCYFVATLTYAFVDGRFYLPFFLLLIPLAILPAEWAVSNALKLRFSLSRVAVLGVFLLACLGYPSQSGFKPKKYRFQAWDALQYPKINGRSPQYEAQRQFAFSFRNAPGIVLSDTDPPYLNVLLPNRFVAAPIDDKHDYRFSRQWRYGKAEAMRLVEGGVNSSTPVYALFVPSQHLDQDIARLPHIEDYTWKRSDRSSKTAVIMILTRDNGVSSPDSIQHG